MKSQRFRIFGVRKTTKKSTEWNVTVSKTLLDSNVVSKEEHGFYLSNRYASDIDVTGVDISTSGFHSRSNTLETVLSSDILPKDTCENAAVYQFYIIFCMEIMLINLANFTYFVLFSTGD